MLWTERIAYELFSLPKPQYFSYESNTCKQEKKRADLPEKENQKIQQKIIELDEPLKQKKETTYYTPIKNLNPYLVTNPLLARPYEEVAECQ